MKILERVRRGVVTIAFALLAGCGGGGGDKEAAAVPGLSAPPAATESLSRSIAPYAQVDARHHAAARFLEQSTFGPTPGSVEALKAGGFAQWIDAQLAAPPSLIDAEPIRDSRFDDPGQFAYPQRAFYRLALSAPDQLRLRMSWALVQLLVVSESRVSGFAMAQYFNLLQRQGFGTYRALLRAVTLHPAMGQFQDNATNRRMDAFPGATPNENFARELMQLFTIGLVELGPDGTPRTGPDGKTIPTYTQKEVEELARALTGWEYDTNGQPRPPTDFGNFASPMRSVAFLHDDGAKRIVGGNAIAAGGSAESDLEALLDVLTAHPNHAPFVSRRLIQHFVTGDPSPAYVGRIAKVFRDSDGDLGRVVKAILLDADARRGDDVGAPRAIVGKVKEPLLGRTQWLRAFACRDLPATAEDDALFTPGQNPFFAPTVFNFHPPDFRIPGTSLNAPEYKLLSAGLLQNRASEMSRRLVWDPKLATAWRAAGCEVDVLEDAQARGDDAILDLVSKRMFRGAMPTYVRDGIVHGVLERTWNRSARIHDAIGLSMVSPAWGVSK
jgi:uncharacterized protein (DUF1800 family)